MVKSINKEDCKALAELYFKAEISTKENIETTRDTVGVGLSGLMVLIMKACGRME